MLQGVWRHCPHGLSLKRLAKETSAQTLMRWKIIRAHIQSTHIYLGGEKRAIEFYVYYSGTCCPLHAASCFFETHQAGSDFCILLHQKKSNMTLYLCYLSSFYISLEMCL